MVFFLLQLAGSILYGIPNGCATRFGESLSLLRFHFENQWKTTGWGCAITKNTVTVTFNTDLAEELEVKPSNFKLVQKDNEFNEPFIQSVKVEGNTVKLTLGDDLVSGKTYVLTSTGLTQEAATKEFTYTKAEASTVTIDTTVIKGVAGEQLKAIVKDAAGNDITEDYTIQWETNSSFINANGVLTGNIPAGSSILAKAYVLNGTTKLYSTLVTIKVESSKAVTYSGYTIDDDGNVDFSALKPEDYVTSVKLNETTRYLVPYVKDQFGEQYPGTFKFTSKNPDILVVNASTGQLTPITTGTATVLVEAGEFKKFITVEVKASAKPTSLSASESNVTLSHQAPNKAVKLTVKDQYDKPVNGVTLTVAVDEADGNNYLDVVDSDGNAQSTFTTDANGEATIYIDPIAVGTETVKVSFGSGASKVETSINVTISEAGSTYAGYVIVNSAPDNKLDVNTGTVTDNELSLTLYPVDANGNIAGSAVDADWTFVDADGNIEDAGDDDTGVVDWVESSNVVTVTANKAGTVTAKAKVGTLEVATFEIEVVDTTAKFSSVALVNNSLKFTIPTGSVAGDDTNADDKEYADLFLDALVDNLTAKDQYGKTYTLASADIEAITVVSSNTDIIKFTNDGDNSNDEFATGIADLTLVFDYDQDGTTDKVLVTKVTVADETAPVATKDDGGTNDKNTVSLSFDEDVASVKIVSAESDWAGATVNFDADTDAKSATITSTTDVTDGKKVTFTVTDAAGNTAKFTATAAVDTDTGAVTWTVEAAE